MRQLNLLLISLVSFTFSTAQNLCIFDNDGAGVLYTVNENVDLRESKF